MIDMLRENEMFNAAELNTCVVTQAMLCTSTGQHGLHVTVADTFLSRFKGLMLSKPLGMHEALLIAPCTSVHTAFMRYPIDVVYLDQAGIVVKCVRRLRPWRASIGFVSPANRRHSASHAKYVLELAAGSIDRLHVQCGDRFEHAVFVPHKKQVHYDTAPQHAKSNQHHRVDAVHPLQKSTASSLRQRGATMIEFAVVGPLIILIGSAILQYGLLFFAKNQMNHAAFMAARAGSTANASMGSIQDAYAKSLIPLYGGGTNTSELATAYAKASGDIAANAQIVMLNPTKESFDDWNDSYLQNKIGNGNRVIPNGNLGSKNPDNIKPNSGQNIQDANLLKLKIVHGYEPKVPLIATVYKKYLQWMDPRTDAFQTQLINAGRIPVVTNVTVQMQSDAIEGQTVSSPGMGNNGSPVNPGDPPTSPLDPPNCLTMGCTVDSTTPLTPGGGGNNGGSTCTGTNCPASQCPVTLPTTLSADALFAFDSSTLTAAGKTKLNQLISYAKTVQFDSVNIAGYTDQIGTTAYNLNLSTQRAQAVANYLSANGFPSVPMNAVGKGASDPVVQTSQCPSSGQAQKDCLAPNRRVVVSLVGVKQ